MTETQLRFLRAIADRVTPDRIAELHLFPPMKQGGTETGVAVVAWEPEVPQEKDVVQPVIGDGGPKVTVFSATYRLTLKGPDRGKWEADVTAEADAPLLTVDEVVRGVQRRAGEGQEPERVSAERLRSLLAEGGTESSWPART